MTVCVVVSGVAPLVTMFTVMSDGVVDVVVPVPTLTVLLFGEAFFVAGCDCFFAGAFFATAFFAGAFFAGCFLAGCFLAGCFLAGFFGLLIDETLVREL